MPIDSPSENAKLSDAQLLGIAEYEKRITNLKNQETAQQRNIAVLTATNIQLERDRVNLENTINEKKPVLEDLNSQILNKNKELADVLNSIVSTRDEEKSVMQRITTANIGFADKTASINQDRELLNKQKLDFSKSVQDHQVEKETLLRKKSLLSEVLNKL